MLPNGNITQKFLTVNVREQKFDRIPYPPHPPRYEFSDSALLCEGPGVRRRRVGGFEYGNSDSLVLIFLLSIFQQVKY